MADLLEWVDPAGDVYGLNDGSWGLQVLWGAEGLFGSPFAYIEQALPIDDGVRVDDISVTNGEISLPWDMVAMSEAQMRSWIDEAAKAFFPKRGVGKLRSTRTDGSGIVREYACTLKEGFQKLRMAVDNGFAVNAPRGTLVFRGGPYWEDASPVTLLLDTDSLEGSFFPTGIPLYLASSTVFATKAITNPGLDEAWPNIYLKGPGEDFKVTDPISGDTFGINYAISEHDAVRIDMREPGNRRAYLESSGLDLMPYSTGDMFPFQPGTTNLIVEYADATTSSLVQIQIWPRWTNP